MESVILVVGASGNVGGALVRRLAARGTVRVRAATRDVAAYAPPAASVEVVAFDYDDPTTYAPALEGVRQAFLMAPPLDARADQRIGPFVDAARDAGVAHLVLMTAQGVEHRDDAPLRKLEKSIEASGLGWTFLRPNWFMENFSSGFALPTIRGQGAIFVPADDARVAFVAVDDIAAVAEASLLEAGHEGQAYTLTGGEALTHAEVANHITQASGRPVAYVSIPDEALREALAQEGLEAASIDYMSTIFGVVRSGLAAAVSPDVERVLHRPPTTFEAFAAQQADAWKA